MILLPFYYLLQRKENHRMNPNPGQEYAADEMNGIQQTKATGKEQ